MSSDINRPLGQDVRPRRQTRSPQWRRRLSGLLAIIAVSGLASYVALQPDAVRPTAPVASDTAPTVEPNVPTAAVAPVDSAPTTSRVPALPGQSGAEIDTTANVDGSTVTIFSPGMRSGSGPVLLENRSAVGQDLRVAHIPEPDLLEDSPFGDLPVQAADGRRPIEAYGRAWSGARGTRIAIVVGGLGLSQTGTQHAIQTLPEEVTLAFAASGNSLQRWMQDARRSGHEILLQVPFEPFDYPAVDPGENTVTIEDASAGNLDDLHRSMARITNYTGIVNFMGGRLMADPVAMEPVMRDLARRGLLFMDDGTSAQSRADMLAGTLAVPFVAADIVLDAAPDRTSILQRLDDLERVAVRQGSAIGIASAFDVSVEAIATWAQEAARRNIEIVGVSALAGAPVRP